MVWNPNQCPGHSSRRSQSSNTAKTIPAAVASPLTITQMSISMVLLYPKPAEKSTPKPKNPPERERRAVFSLLLPILLLVLSVSLLCLCLLSDSGGVVGEGIFFPRTVDPEAKIAYNPRYGIAPLDPCG